MIISIEYFYWLAGVLLLITAGMILIDRTHPKRWTSGLFWPVQPRHAIRRGCHGQRRQCLQCRP